VAAHLRQVSGEELGHAESADAVVAEDLGHLLVGHEELFVLGVLQVVLLDVGPQLLDAFGAAGLLLANDVGELSAELHGFGKSGSLRHFDRFLRVFRRIFDLTNYFDYENLREISKIRTSGLSGIWPCRSPAVYLRQRS